MKPRAIFPERTGRLFPAPCWSLERMQLYSTSNFAFVPPACAVRHNPTAPHVLGSWQCILLFLFFK